MCYVTFSLKFCWSLERHTYLVSLMNLFTLLVVLCAGLYLVFAFHKPYNSSRRDESDTYLGSTGGGHEKLAEEKHGDKLGDKHDDKHCNEHDDKHDNEHDDEHNKHDNEHDREDYNKYCNRSSDEGNDSKRPCLSGDVQPD